MANKKNKMSNTQKSQSEYEYYLLSFTKLNTVPKAERIMKAKLLYGFSPFSLCCLDQTCKCTHRKKFRVFTFSIFFVVEIFGFSKNCLSGSNGNDAFKWIWKILCLISTSHNPHRSSGAVVKADTKYTSPVNDII